jgi:hypothetical protein
MSLIADMSQFGYGRSIGVAGSDPQRAQGGGESREKQKSSERIRKKQLFESVSFE